MATNYPGGFDSLSNPSGTDPLDASGVPHASQHANANDAIEAIEATLGLNPQSNWPTVSDRIAAVQAGSITPGVITWTSPGVISVNSASDGLRITQTGAGNALVVEDSANPDASPFVVDANGRVVVGDVTARNTSSVAGKVQIDTISVFDGGFGGYAWTNDTNAQISTFNKSRGTSTGSHVVVQANDTIADLRFAGSDGTTFIEAARIQGAVDGTPGTSDMPGRLVFSTTADGASSPTERMRIDNAGQITTGLGSASAPVLSFIGDTNTGIYSPGADQVAISTAGTARVAVTAAGNVGIGMTNPGYMLELQDGNQAITRYGTTTKLTLRYGNGSSGTPTIVSSGNAVGDIEFLGYDGSSFQNVAYIRAAIDGTPGAGDMPGRLTLWTVPDGSTTLTERMRIDNAGLITGTGTSLGAWTAYTPTLGGSGWAIGDGTAYGYYCQVGKIVHFRIDIAFGSTSTFGSSLTITVPVTMGGSFSRANSAQCVLTDASASASYTGVARMATTTTLTVQSLGTAGLHGTLNSTTPFAWASADGIRVSGTYEAA